VAGVDIDDGRPDRWDIVRCESGGIIKSCVVTRYQLGLLRQAGSLIVPPSASTPTAPASRP